MATGRKQKRNKKVSCNEINNRIIVGKLEKIDPLAPIDKVRTVAKPNCDQTIQAKKVSLNVKAPKASVKKRTTSGKSGDGAKAIGFQKKGVRAKAGKVDMRNGDGTHGVNFGLGGVKSKTRTADMRNDDGTHGVNFHK